MTEDRFIEAAIEFIQQGDLLVMRDSGERPGYWLEFHTTDGRITMTVTVFRRILGNVRQHCERLKKQDQLIWKWRG